MEYITLPGLDKPVPKIFFGSDRLQFVSREQAFNILDEVYDAGIRGIDTAQIYGNAEELLGEWMEKKGIRDELVILTKCCHHNDFRKRVHDFDLKSDVYDSLAKLKTDYIDILLLHRDDPTTPVEEIIRPLDEFKRQGIVHCYGGSNWTTARIQEINTFANEHGLTPFAASSPNFSLADQMKELWENGGCLSISGPANESERKWYADNNMAVFAWSSLGRGFFSGHIHSDSWDDDIAYLDDAARRAFAYPENREKLRRVEILAKEKGFTVPQIAMAWVLKQDFPTVAIVCASSKAHMEMNLQALEVKLSDEEWKYISTHSYEECKNMKARIDLLEVLAEAEEDVKNNRIAPVSDTFNDLRKMLQEV